MLTYVPRLTSTQVHAWSLSHVACEYTTKIGVHSLRHTINLK